MTDSFFEHELWNLCIRTVSSLLVVPSFSVEIDASVPGLVPEHCESLCTSQDLFFASDQKHSELSDGWHLAGSSNMCPGHRVIVHLPVSSPGHYSIGLLTQAHLLCLCQFSLISVIGNGGGVAEVSVRRQQDYDRCHSQHYDMSDCLVPLVDASD